MWDQTQEKDKEEAESGRSSKKSFGECFRRLIVAGFKTVRKVPWKKCFAVLLWICLIAAGVFFGGKYLLSEELEVTFHHLYSPKIIGASNTRIIVLSDLHNREFGPGNTELIKQINILEPDLIVMAGDMVNADNEDLDILLNLCEDLLGIAPVYFSPGNHESNLMYEKGIPLEETLSEKGVHVLVNRAEEVVIRGTPFQIGSLTTSPEGYYDYGVDFIKEFEKSREFKLLLSHYPSLYYGALADTEIDLGICGHYHGGVVRLPVIGGLYHGDTGFFPKYSCGMYRLPHSTIFVSRGMGDHSGYPRVNNRPELAVIDINGRQETDLP